jgi:hypothetical protein
LFAILGCYKEYGEIFPSLNGLRFYLSMAFEHNQKFQQLNTISEMVKKRSVGYVAAGQNIASPKVLQ